MKYWILLKKEFKETIRDKSVLISNFVFPLLSLPMILIFSIIASGIVAMNLQESQFQVWLVGEPPIEIVKAITKSDTVAISRHKGIDHKDEELLKKKLKVNEVDLFLFSEKLDDGYKFKIVSDSGKTKSFLVSSTVRKTIKKYAKAQRENKLKTLGLKEDQLSPVKVESKDFATLIGIASQSFGGQAGVVIVVLLIIGMYYPAINAFIGEKDKKTLNVLIFAADDENKIVLSKYINIVIFGLLTFVPYILDYLIIKSFMGNKISKYMTSSIDPKVIMVLGMNVLVLSLVLGALCVIISILSKTMTRAQSFLSGIFILLMIPIIFLVAVKEKMTVGMALVPIMNFFYLARDVALDQVAMNNSILSIFVNLAFVFILMKIALGAFKKRHVLKV